MKNHYKLLIGLVVGIVSGTLLHPYQDQEWVQHINNYVMMPIGQIFLRLLFMIVVPMVFSALILGVYDLANTRVSVRSPHGPSSTQSSLRPSPF